MYSRFPQLLEKPPENRLKQAKIEAQAIMTDILSDTDFLVSMNDNRRRRETEDYFDNLEFVFANITSITAVNVPFGSESFHVTFE